MRRNGDIYFLGPLLERDHVLSQTKLVSRIYTYRDYPGEVHPIRLFADWFRELHLDNSAIGYDSSPGYVSYWAVFFFMLIEVFLCSFIIN